MEEINKLIELIGELEKDYGNAPLINYYLNKVNQLMEGATNGKREVL